jgi:hypothetical protein
MSWWKAALPLIVAGLLSGCVSDREGYDYAAISRKIGPPKPGQSRIVVLSEKGNSFSAAGCNLAVDGGAAGTVNPGTYVYVDRPAGRHELVATQALFPGDTRREVATAAGRTHFFLVKNSSRADTVNGGVLIGGLVGMAVASAVTAGSDNPGPVELYPLEESAARTILANLQLAKWAGGEPRHPPARVRFRPPRVNPTGKPGI